MAKPTRQQRREANAKVRQTRLQTVVMVAAMIAATAAPAAEASKDVHVDAQEEHVMEETPMTDSTPTIPPPPPSGVRLVEPIIEPDTSDSTELLEEIRSHRLFDRHLATLIGVCLSAEDVLRMAYYTSMRDFLTSCGWRASALQSMRFVNSVALWTKGLKPTAAGEAVWLDFRRRVRREGAHLRIAYKRIGEEGSALSYTTEVNRRPRSRAA
ncbi:MAG: hypothetical protein ABIO72_04990 [Patescibacteria group bacterium]